MIDHDIEHTTVVVGEIFNISPASGPWIDTVVINNRKAVVGRVGVKGQEMNTVDQASKMGVGEIPQRDQGRLPLAVQLIGIGDKEHIFTADFGDMVLNLLPIGINFVNKGLAQGLRWHIRIKRMQTVR